jgi:hypothetical protein
MFDIHLLRVEQFVSIEVYIIVFRRREDFQLRTVWQMNKKKHKSDNE